MDSYYTKVSLRFFHPSEDLQVFCSILELKPSIVEKKGNINPRIKGYSKYYEKSFCVVRFPDSSIPLSEKIIKIMNDLVKNKENIIKFHEDGGEIGFFVGLFTKENNLEIVSYEAIRLLFSLRIKLDISFYDNSEL